MFAEPLIKGLNDIRPIEVTSICYSPVTELEKRANEREDSLITREMYDIANRLNCDDFYVGDHAVPSDFGNLYDVYFTSTTGTVTEILDPITLLEQNRYCRHVQVTGRDFANNEPRELDVTVFPNMNIWVPHTVSYQVAQLILSLGYHVDFAYTGGWAAMRNNIEWFAREDGRV